MPLHLAGTADHRQNRPGAERLLDVNGQRFTNLQLSPETVAKINKEVRELFADPEFQQTFLDRYLFQSIAGSPEDLMSFVKSEEPKWRKTIQDAKIKVE